MRFVVKITGESSVWPQWIGHSTSTGHKAFVPIHEARVFQTAIEAEREADVFRALLPDGVQFEIQQVPTLGVPVK
jgi:hypothetical protein